MYIVSRWSDAPALSLHGRHEKNVEDTKKSVEREEGIHARVSLSRALFFSCACNAGYYKILAGAILVSVLTGMWNFSAITVTLPEAENRFAFSFVESNYLYFILASRLITS